MEPISSGGPGAGIDAEGLAQDAGAANETQRLIEEFAGLWIDSEVIDIVLDDIDE